MKGLPILEATCQKTKQKGPPIGNKSQGGRTMRGSDTSLAIVAYHLRPVWAHQREARRRRAARAANASRLSVAVVGSGILRLILLPS